MKDEKINDLEIKLNDNRNQIIGQEKLILNFEKRNSEIEILNLKKNEDLNFLKEEIVEKNDKNNYLEKKLSEMQENFNLLNTNFNERLTYYLKENSNDFTNKIMNLQAKFTQKEEENIKLILDNNLLKANVKKKFNE